MNHSEDLNPQNFRLLIEKYETVIRDVTVELDAVQAEHNSIRGALRENTELSAQLSKILAEKVKTCVEHKCEGRQLVENLQLQLRALLEEKEQAVKLWQNASSTVDILEEELKSYQDHTDGLIPKTKLVQLKNDYEAKIKELQDNVSLTKTKLEELIHEKTQELRAKDDEIAGTLHTQDSAFKIVRNLEDEVLNLQQRLNTVNADKKALEKTVKTKCLEIESLKEKVKECRFKVEESLQVVEAALNEKDAALMRENKTREEICELTKSLDHVIKETNNKMKTLQQEHEQKLEKALHALNASHEDVRAYSNKCTFLEKEIERVQKGLTNVDENSTAKMLTLEKNLETTFQKLLLSEKQNIQLKAEMENIKSDLDQMAHHYERDVAARETEKGALKEEIKKLTMALNESIIKLSHNEETVKELNEKLSLTKVKFDEQIEDMKQQSSRENAVVEEEYKATVAELQLQLHSQIKLNKKWRTETKKITNSMETRIKELKLALNKIKLENKILLDKLKQSNAKMEEYRSIMDLISKDVNKITDIALPEMGEMFSMLTTMLMIKNKDHSTTK